MTIMHIAYIRVRHEVYRGLGVLVHQPRALVSVLIGLTPGKRIGNVMGDVNAFYPRTGSG